MAELKSYALVLRTKDYREADKLVTLLTREEGKITVIARGVKKTNSRFKALVEPLTLGYFLLHRGKTLDTLIQGEIIKPYSRLHADLFLLAYAQYFCELSELTLVEREPAVGLFNLIIAALNELEKEVLPVPLTRCFELNLLDLLGYRPYLEHCLHCGGQEMPFRFDPVQGGLICKKCAVSEESFPVSGAAVSIMRRFLESGFDRLSICHVSQASAQEIFRVTRAMLDRITGQVQFKTMKVLSRLEQF